MRIILLFFFALFCQITLAQNKTTQDYILKYKKIALQLSDEYAIPVEVILSLAIIESGSGQSKMAVNLNNHFAVAGPNKVKYKTRYKQYDAGEDSFKDFCRLIATKNFYPKLKGNANSHLWIKAIAKIGYSESPKVWKKSIKKTIKIYKLDKIKFP
jgi:Bax protein